MSTERAIALALLTQGADRLTAPEIQRYAELLGVSTRQIYRYLDKIGKAKFLLKAVDELWAEYMENSKDE